MALKEKGADGEKGEGVAAHDDDDHVGHRSKDEDEVSCWFGRIVIRNRLRCGVLGCGDCVRDFETFEIVEYVARSMS
jgi:hypothetical protein